MGLLDAYATDEEYRSAVNSTDTSSSIGTALLGTSRLLERELYVPPGAWNQDGTVAEPAVRVFDAFGGTMLYLRDREGFQSSIISIATNGIGVDSERDGTFDGYTFDLTDSWVRPLQNVPYHAIELLPYSGADIAAWPDGSATVQISGIFGWPQVPELIKQLVIRLTHELRIAQASGMGGQSQYIDNNHALSNETYWLWREAKGIYSRKATY